MSGFALPSCAEGGRQVGPLQGSGRPFMVPAREDASEVARVTAGLMERVARHGDSVAQVPIAPNRAAPVIFERGEARASREHREVDADSCVAGDRLAPREAEKRAGPRRRARAREGGLRPVTVGPGLGVAVPERNAEGGVSTDADEVRGRARPGAEIRWRAAGPQPGVQDAERLTVCRIEQRYRLPDVVLLPGVDVSRCLHDGGEVFRHMAVPAKEPERVQEFVRDQDGRPPVAVLVVLLVDVDAGVRDLVSGPGVAVEGDPPTAVAVALLEGDVDAGAWVRRGRIRGDHHLVVVRQRRVDELHGSDGALEILAVAVSAEAHDGWRSPPQRGIVHRRRQVAAERGRPGAVVQDAVAHADAAAVLDHGQVGEVEVSLIDADHEMAPVRVDRKPVHVGGARLRSDQLGVIVRVGRWRELQHGSDRRATAPTTTATGRNERHGRSARCGDQQYSDHGSIPVDPARPRLAPGRLHTREVSWSRLFAAGRRVRRPIARLFHSAGDPTGRVPVCARGSVTGAGGAVKQGD